MIVKESFNWKNPSLKPNSPKPPLPGRKDSMKVTFSDTNNPNIVRIFCMCHCLNALQFHFDFEEDEDGDIVYINALMDARHYKCASPMPKKLCDNYRNVIETYLKEEAELGRIE